MSKVTFTHKSITPHRELADAIKENLEHTITGTSASIKEKVAHAAFDNNLPEGLTPELAGKLTKYYGDFSKSTHVAMTETSADIFNANPDVTVVHAEIGVFGHGDFSNLTIEKAHNFPNNKAKEGEPSHKPTYLHVMESTTLRDSSFKAMKKAISAEFKDKYAN